MSERDERVERVEALAEWLHEAECTYRGPQRVCSGPCGFRTQALLDSPAMRDLLAEAWDEGHRQHAPVLEFGETPCYEPNPYRQEAR